jgi:hypothetical protein
VATTEVMATKSWLELANSIGCHAIQVDSDSLEVINICSGVGRFWNEATTIYVDCEHYYDQEGRIQTVSKGGK